MPDAATVVAPPKCGALPGANSRTAEGPRTMLDEIPSGTLEDEVMTNEFHRTKLGPRSTH